MIKNYNLIKLLETYRKHFWNLDPGSKMYWLLVSLVTHFFKPHRKRQIVPFRLVDDYVYNKLIEASYRVEIISPFDQEFDSVTAWEFRDFLCVLKLLSEADSEKLDGFIYLGKENGIYTFEKVEIPEDGGELVRLGIYFDVTFGYFDDGDDDVEYCAAFCFTDSENTVKTNANVVFYTIKNKGSNAEIELKLCTNKNDMESKK